MRKRIVVVEDEEDILDIIIYNLNREGYEVLGAKDGAGGLDLVSREVPDLVLLDIMLPGLDGIEVCRRMKAESATARIPIIMVSARGEESDVVLGLGLGADDYIPKPFKPRELVARVKAVLRRIPGTEGKTQTRKIVCGNITIDADRHEVLVHGRSIDLTATEMRLLEFMAKHPGRVFTRDHLVSRAIGDGVVVTDRNIDVHVRAIRKKLGDDCNYIGTVRGVGYRLQDEL